MKGGFPNSQQNSQSWLGVMEGRTPKGREGRSSDGCQSQHASRWKVSWFQQAYVWPNRKIIDRDSRRQWGRRRGSGQRGGTL